MYLILERRQRARKSIKRIVPKQYRQAWNVDSAFKQIQWGRNFYLAGPVGIGKTHALYAYFKRLTYHELHRTGLYAQAKIFSYALVTSSIRWAEWDKKIDMIEHMQQVGYCFIDDLGSEYRTPFSDDVLFQVLDYRLNNCKITSFTSNFRIGHLKYEDRVKSRILGLVGDNRVYLKGEDRRKPVRFRESKPRQ